MSEGENDIGGRIAGVLGNGASTLPERGPHARIAGERVKKGKQEAPPDETASPDPDPLLHQEALLVEDQASAEDHWLADGALDAEGDRSAAPSVVIVDADAGVRATLLEHLAPACAAHEAEPAGAVALLQGLACVHIALVDCDPPPSLQAPIFRALSRWPGAVCVLMSQNHQKVEQLRALGMFAPLVLDKPLQPEALNAIRAAVQEIAEGGVA